MVWCGCDTGVMQLWQYGVVISYSCILVLLARFFFSFFRKTSNSTYVKLALSYCGPLLWNSLPPNLTSITSLLSFRKGLKTLLFELFLAKRS